MLSTDINKSINRVNSIINKLLENHLCYKYDTLNDKIILKKKKNIETFVPHEETLKILKEINELIANRK